MVLSIVLWTIGVLALIEALFLLLFPKWSVECCKKIGKWKPKKARFWGWLELLIAIIIGLIAYYV